MEKDYPQFSIIFVNYQSVLFLENALKSLFSYETEAFFEVIIVNNDKKEKEAIERLKKSFSVKVIQNEDNRGFASAVNQGIEVAQSQWIGLLNPDILWPKTQLRDIQLYAKNEDVLFGLVLCDEMGKKERFGSGKKITFLQLFLNHLFLYQKKIKNKQSVDWISGGALFFRKELWKDLGGFDENYFLYYEDVDFCERARQKENKLYLLNQFSVIHFRGKSQESGEKQKEYYRKSQKLYFSKFRPWYEVRLLNIYQSVAKSLW